MPAEECGLVGNVENGVAAIDHVKRRRRQLAGSHIRDLKRHLLPNVLGQDPEAKFVWIEFTSSSHKQTDSMINHVWQILYSQTGPGQPCRAALKL